MMTMGQNIILMIWISMIGLSTQYSSDQTLYIGNDCENYKIHHVNKEDTYTIVWNGGVIPNYCSIGFIGRDDGYMNEYKVCVEAETWKVPNCGAKVKLEKGVVSVLSEVYSCYQSPSSWCGDSDDYVDIMFESTPTHSSGQTAEIRLKVTATMTYNYTMTIGLAVGGCVGGLFFLILAIVLISRVRARRLSPVILTSGYSAPTQAQGLRNPVMYSNTSGSYPDSFKPPPSYESVMNTSPYAPPPISTNPPVNGS
ncbi:uncharacterized protein LOC110456162 [Mizuhopecten yessoensis]|uniref:Uncharacterized protein n=1 Tax=Mizuhopecten yessoensis TaxID=6573 RepID=A0A210R441_MIZYE|nr:uncharacterized protein LOC110456162 [Mizuhopecten yessoensis]OWF55715.1 hypothetical protein KP79_PYT11164 [Mizuhopecten yessoensis]